MSIKSRLVSNIRDVLQLAYTPSIKSVSQTLGLHNQLLAIYKSIDVPFKGTIEFEVAGRSILVEPATERERRGIKKYQQEEQPIIADLLENLRDDDVFYDVGAWVGTYSCLAAATQPSATVHAFEPGRERFEKLRNTILINGSDVIPHPVALSTENGTTSLSSGGVLGDNSGNTENVEVVDADTYLTKNDIEVPTVIKIDVEGAEMNVIHGLQDALLRKECRLLYCEVHPHMGVDPDDLYSLLESFEFSITELHDRGDVHFIRAEKGE